MGHVRVRGHNYHGKGYYFITFTTLNRNHCLSHIESGQIILKQAGKLLLDAWQKIAIEDPAYELGVTATMPDHFHGLAIARRAPNYVIGTHIARVKGRVLHAMRKILNKPDMKMWEDGFYDYLSLNIKMFKAFEAYIIDNPLRHQLRHDNPDWFKKQFSLTHPRLPQSTIWTAYGDATLLDHPYLIPIIVSNKLSDHERSKQIANILDKVKQGAIPIGGFISPGERQVAKEITKIKRSRIIKLEPWGLKRYKPKGSLATRWLADGRTLILTGFSDNQPEECVRSNCLINNEWVKKIAFA